MEEQLNTMINNQNNLFDKQKELQDSIADKQAQQQVDRLNYNKDQQQIEAEKAASGLYANYKKQVTPFSANAEYLAQQGLNNSGYSESSKVNMYNQYQANVTSLMNNNNKIKSEFDLSINEAYQNADIQKAQNEFALFENRINLMLQEFQLKYQLHRDRIQDQQWERQFGLQQAQENRAQANFNLAMSKANRRSS